MPIINNLREIYLSLNFRFIPNFRKEIEHAVGHCKNLLDIGCGSNSPIRYFSKKPYCVGVDAFEPSIKKSMAKKIHDEYFLTDILEIDKKIEPNSFECVIALDVIEHFTKKEGYLILDIMEKIASKKIIVFTPNGFVPQGVYDENPWQVHKSGWTVEEMRKRGYKVIGINGWKFLKGEFGAPRFKPKLLWFFVGEFTQLFVRNRPEQAFHLLSIKQK